MALYQETLATYRTRVLRELRDATQQYFNNQGSGTPYADIDAWIQEAMRWRDMWSGGNRVYKNNVALTTGLDQYDLTLLFPTDTVLDIATMWLIYGNARVQMNDAAFSDVTNLWRPWLNYSNVPGAWCRYGATKLFIATAPSAAYSVDIDAVTLSVPLVNPGDTDALPYPYTEPVPKYAAYLAKQNQRRFDDAMVFYQEAVRALHDIEGSRVGQLPVLTTSPAGNRR